MRHTDWDSDEFKELDVTEQLNAILASAAALAVETEGGKLPGNVEEITDGAAFVIPLLIPEELESGDGRKMEKGALSTRNLPITLLWQPATGDGHNGSYIVGRIDTLEEVDSGLGNARGVFDTGPYGREAERLVRTKMLRGVSADLDMFEATIDGEGNELAEDFDPNKIKNEKMTVTRARVMAATLVAKPAFQECTIELVTEENMTDQIPLEDGVYEENPPEALAAEYALSTIIASAAPVNPPSAWFSNPELEGPTPLTVDDDGHVFGHIATWDTDHVAFSTGVRPPRSRSNYAYFRTGLVKTIEGDDVAVGQLTLIGGHAPLDANAQLAVKHYDDTNSAVADVNAGEDQFGIWVSGALRPTVTPEQVRVFRASAPSGDWRPINGTLELVAVCQVNVPGFPVARARVASGAVMALVAAGTATLHKIRTSEHDQLADRVSRMERMVLERRKQELAANFAPVKEARINRLREAAAQARAALAPELERRAQLSVDAEQARARIAEFKLSVAPKFEEKHHPRDDEGKFKEVLLKLSDIISGDEDTGDAAGAKQTLERAIDLEKNGDTEGANQAAEQAKSEVEGAAAKVEGPAADALKEVAADIGKATSEAAGDAADDVVEDIADEAKEVVEDTAKGDLPGDDDGGAESPVSIDDIDVDDIPEPIKEFLELMIDELGENVDPMTILSRMDNQMKHWVEGKGFDSPQAITKLLEKILQRPLQPDIVQ